MYVQTTTFISRSLARFLLQKLNTIRCHEAYRRKVPKTMAAKTELFNRKFIFSHYNAICLVSYYGERKRNSVLLLSSSHKDTILINDETMKLIMLLIYL